MKKSFFKKLYITIATGVFSLALALGFISMQPVTQKADATSSFSLQKTSFVEGEAIYVSATGSGTDWVGIFREGESSSVLWYYVAQNPSPFNILNGTPNAGESAASVTAGNYVVAYVPNDLPGISNATQTQPITVLPASSPSAQMSLNKTSFVEGEPINVTAFGSGTDWVGIYREGQTLSARWYYVANAGSGATVNIATYGNNNEGNGISATISAGNYVVYLIRNDGDYTSAEIAIPITVSKASALRVEKTEFELKQPIFVTATHSDPNAWVGLYRSTESSYCRWYYVSSANGVPYDITNGEKNIEASYSPNVMRGDYYLRLFDDDGAVVEEIAISVIADPTIPSAPLSATYSLEKDTDGYATGTVSVTMPTSDLTDRCIALFWGDDDGVFENYSYTKFKVTGETTSFTFGKNVIIPFGATKLYVYAKNTNGDALSTTPVIVDLPQGASQKNPLNSTGNSFWVISDTHVDQDVNHVHNQHFAGLLQDIARIDGGAMSLIVNGDMTNRGRDEDWANFQALYDAASGVPPMVLAMGNHEYYSGSYEYVNSKFYELAKYPDGTLVNKMHYDYWQGGYHFVFLGTDTWPQNNTHAVLTQETLNWLDATLDDGKDEHKPTFLFLHQPLYNTVAGSRPGEDYSGVEASSEAALRTILADHPEVMLFVGHTHWTMNAEANMYEGTAELPVRMFNTSSAGYLWTTYDNASGDYLYGSEGYYLRVDGSTLYVMGYDFVNDQWISAAQYCIELDPATDEGGNETVPPVHDCTDEDDNHLCDVCDERLSDCTDSEDDGDHNCDVCGESYGTHDYNSGRWSCTQTQHAPYCECGLTGTYENHYDSPKDGDHFCDTCNYPTSTCADNDNDHDCDDCGTTLSSCEDLDKNHVCDLCNDILSSCEDDNNDHLCDVCGDRLTDCVDEDDDHYCDTCNTQISHCESKDKDHLCDVCGEIVNECDDLDNDHLCDVCDKKLSDCLDDIPDHICEICGEKLGDCADDDNDHLCDLCTLPVSFCQDTDPADHFCDICGGFLGACQSGDGDHFCDVCNNWMTCFDQTSDHLCDVCGEIVSECGDYTSDHLCDVCGERVSNCQDENNDHFCDICDGPIHVCKDDDGDHLCDTCDETLSSCDDLDGDHLCDTCGTPLSSCTDEDDHYCDICGNWTGDCDDQNNDHFCDICDAQISGCEDEDADHRCDTCNAPISNCEDYDGDGSCDVCGAPIDNTGGDNEGGEGGCGATISGLSTCIGGIALAFVAIKKKRR